MNGDFIFNHKDFKIIIENSGTSAVEALISAFRDGTIPAFEYNLRSGDITLDSKKIASVSTETDSLQMDFMAYIFIDFAKMQSEF